MKFYLLIIVLLFFSACSNEGGSTDLDSNATIPPPLDANTTPPSDTNTTPSPDPESNNSNPLFYQQWSINDNSDFYLKNSVDADAHINAKESFKIYTGKGVKVAVIDDGFDINHPEIKDKIIATISVDKNANVGSDVSHTDSAKHHGTSVAGIIASADNNIGLMGVAPDVELILIKYPDELDDAVLIEMFNQAVSAGADIINCSWGTGEVSDTFRDYMESLNVTVVFASGNGNKDMGNDESAISSVIGVGATDKENLRTSYSDYGKDLDLVAPGGGKFGLGITTLDNSASDGASVDEYLRYDEFRDGSAVFFVGTSASAPIVSGVIALALEKNPNLTRVEIQELLKISTSKIGQDTPYIDDMIKAPSSSVIITGMYGTDQNNDMKVRLTSHKTANSFGFYSIDSIGNNEWSSIVTDSLADDNYTVEVISLNTIKIWATDELFEINASLTTLEVNKSRRKSNYYGYGKIDVDKFISNIKIP